MDEVRWLKTEGGKQEARDKEGDEKVERLENKLATYGRVLMRRVMLGKSGMLI